MIRTRDDLWRRATAYDLVRALIRYAWCEVTYRADDCANPELADEQEGFARGIASAWFAGPKKSSEESRISG